MDTQQSSLRLTFDASVGNGVGQITLKDGSFLLGTNTPAKIQLFDVLREWDNDENVSAVLIFNEADALSASKHGAYLEELSSIAQGKGIMAAELLIQKELETFRQFAAIAARYRKLLVSCLSGDICSPFIGLSLFTDFRIAEEGTTLTFSHVRQGTPPSGGLSCMLEAFTSRGTANRLLLRGGQLDAQQATEAGLVETVIAEKPFADGCEQYMQDLIDGGTSHVAAVKALMFSNWEDLDRRLELETTLRMRAMYRQGSR